MGDILRQEHQGTVEADRVHDVHGARGDYRDQHRGNLNQVDLLGSHQEEAQEVDHKNYIHPRRGRKASRSLGLLGTTVPTMGRMARRMARNWIAAMTNLGMKVVVQKEVHKTILHRYRGTMEHYLPTRYSMTLIVQTKTEVDNFRVRDDHALLLGTQQQHQNQASPLLSSYQGHSHH